MKPFPSICQRILPNIAKFIYQNLRIEKRKDRFVVIFNKLEVRNN